MADKLLVSLVPAGATVLAAMISALPSLANSTRGRDLHDDPPCVGPVVMLQAPAVWQRGVEQIFTDPKSGKDARHKAMRGCRAASVVAVVLTVAYIAVAARFLHVPGWLFALAVVPGAWVTWVAERGRHALARTDGQVTMWSPGKGKIHVVGDPDEVMQLCLHTLRRIGARVVSVRRRSIVAGSGVSLGGYWLGNRIEVSVAPGEDYVVVRITSTKLDYVTPVRTRRDVQLFLDAWAYPPAAGLRSSTDAAPAES